LPAVALPDQPLLAAPDGNPPDLAHRALAIRRAGDSFGGKDDLLAVRRPGGVAATLSQPAWGLTRGAHHEDTATLASGAKSDAVAIGREGRLRVVRRRVVGQVPVVRSADHPLEEDVRPAALRLDIGEEAAVRCEAGKGLPSGQVGQAVPAH